MFNSIDTAFTKSELDYRSSRIRAGVGNKRRAHVRRLRRPAEGTENAR